MYVKIFANIAILRKLVIKIIDKIATKQNIVKKFVNFVKLKYFSNIDVPLNNNVFILFIYKYVIFLKNWYCKKKIFAKIYISNKYL